LSSPDNPQFEPQPPVNTEPSPLSPIPPPLVVPDLRPPSPVTPPPPRDPVWSGWDVVQIAALGLVSLILAQIGIFGGAKLLHPDLSLKQITQAVQDSPQKTLLAIALQLMLYVVVAAYMVLVIQVKHRAHFWKAIRWSWPREQWMTFMWGAAGGFLLIVLTILSHFLPMPKSTPFEEFFARPIDAYIVSIFAITLGPLMEELFFRGFLYPVLARRLGIVWGVILTALPFALLHMFQYGYAWGIVFVIFLMGVACTAVRAVTGSVASSFLVHVGYNATEMFFVALATGGFRHMEKIGLLF
jgi:membrane protease YdiL (CAAX protease family)